MEIDSPPEFSEEMDSNLDVDEINRFSKEAARAFFAEYGLIHHQISSYNDFVTGGIQKLLDSLGEVDVASGYEKKSEHGWKYASVTYGKVRLERPAMFNDKNDFNEFPKLLPRHARLQHMSYSARMYVEVTVQVYTREIAKSDKYKTSKEHPTIGRKILFEDKDEIIMGTIPVMVGSKLCWLHKHNKSDCHFDCGGYFVIKGAEKVFIAQEKLCLTRLWISDKPWRVAYWPRLKRERVFVLLNEEQKYPGYNGTPTIKVSLLYIEIPIWILFFALGAASDKEVFEMINFDTCDAGLLNILLASIRSADDGFKEFRLEGKAREYIAAKIDETKFPPNDTVAECISTYLFATIDGLKEKAFFLGYMVKSLLLAYSGKRKCDDRDDFRNKRLDLAGDLLARELRIHIRHAERRMVRAMQRDLYGDRNLRSPGCYLDASIVTNGLTKAFSTGIWSHPSKMTEKCSGVVATLRRTNPLQMMSDLRKTRQQVAYAGKAGDARYPNPSYWGRLCFLSTPDGENCGLVKNLAVTGLVSSNIAEQTNSTGKLQGLDKAGSSKGSSSMEPILKKLTKSGMELLGDIPFTCLSGMDKVFLNGDWVGVCHDSRSFVTNLRSMRRKRLIDPQVEIKRDEHMREVRIFSDSGRILRPLLIVENLGRVKSFMKSCKEFPMKSEEKIYSFQSLLEAEMVELIGVEEEEDYLTAWGAKHLISRAKTDISKQYTHCELDLSFLLGLSCSLIPFANHNFARRILFQSEKHSQQGIGFSTTNLKIRTDTLSHQMYYPQIPLFKTMVADCLGKTCFSLSRPEFFNGQNAIVAVNVHQGYNQEDSLVMSRASLERGMFRTEHFKSYKSEVDNRGQAKRLKPKDVINFGKMESKVGRIDSLDEDGFPSVGASLQTGDIIIGKVAESGVDHCVKLKHTEKGMVQKVVLASNDDGKNFAAVTLRQVRSPCVGDKFSSMHGQKGVIGFVESQENFPFTLQGIVPDIVINPHAFPTRQTPGQLLEAALSKGISCGGSVRYATPFTTASIDDITDQLHRTGFSRWGSERVCNGRTGEMMPSMIFIGPTFYQRLIHMAEDKMKFRNTGPVHPLTRQPVSDRKRFGGVKFGEMERDCLLAHGAAANLYERLFTLSDFSQMHICQTCQRVANVIQRPLPGGQKIRGPFCPFCKSAENIVKVNVPYGAKLLYQELFSMGICLTFETEVS